MHSHFALNSSSSRDKEEKNNGERVKEFGPFCIRVLVPSARRLLKPREVEEKWLSVLNEACSAGARVYIVVVSQIKSAAWPICGRACMRTPLYHVPVWGR